MKTIFLVLLIMSMGVLSVPVYAADSSSIQIELVMTPKPTHNQLFFGETYVFAVKVLNLNLDLKKDEPVDPAKPHFKFSGDLVVLTSYEVGKQGSYRVGRETIPYNHSLQRWDKFYDIALPEIRESKSILFTHRMVTGYDGEAKMDEWVTFTLDVYVYVEGYYEGSEDKKYYLGDQVDETHLTLFVISDEKRAFVADALKLLYKEVVEAKYAVTSVEEVLNVELDVDMSSYDDAYLSMKAYFDDEDYVSAMTEYSSVEPTWKDDMIASLQNLVEELQGTIDIQEQQIDGLITQFSDLTLEIQNLQAEFENNTAVQAGEIEQRDEEIGQLNTQLSSLKSTNRFYLFAVIAVVVISALILVRLFLKK